jgi:hypothetical protein
MEGKDGGFDKTISGFRLHPVQFISKKNTEAERSQHSSVGELATGCWAFIKCAQISLDSVVHLDHGLQRHHQVLDD